eukprot:TRINITY_DN2808_c0_g1_i1.p1 TRINITY_DN2808_c0_g1~~TRINITY_DN2808_c0_g1_i1.p1  ORF type:complete len:143 (-),score=24.49 TRINITY_DN2808_c0_g1_i1:23-451(-)
MIKLAIQEDKYCNDWVYVSEWESSLPYFEDFPGVGHEHKNLLSKLEDGKKISMYYICGEDHVIKCGLNREIKTWCDGIVCISRKGSSIKSKSLAENFFYVETDLELDFSSTKMREMMLGDFDLSNITYENVSKFISTFIKLK